MSLTKIGSIGINTGIQFAGVTTVTTLKVGSGVTVSSDGDVFFTGIATGNGSGLTALNASNISSGTVPTARLGSGTASSSTFLRGDSTFQTVNTDLVSDTSPQLGGDLASNGNDIVMADNDKIKVGTGGDLEIFHQGFNSKIADVGTGALILSGSTVKIENGASDETQAVFTENGAVELYHDNVKRFETDSNGARVVAPEGARAELRIIGDEGDDNNDYFKLSAGEGTLKLQDASNGSTWEDNIVINAAGSVELYHDNTKKFETTSYGNASAGQLRVTSSNASTVAFSVGDAGTGFYNTGSNAIGYAVNGTQKWNINSGGHLTLLDTVELQLGTSSDLQISHDGSTNIIDGRFHPIELRHQSEVHIKCVDDGAVELYHDNTKQCETSANGLAFPSGKGIDFSATADGGTGSVDELLDDYEVGTFTATLSGIGGGTNPSFSAQTSSAGYTKIGGQVHVYGYLFNVNVSSSGSGTITVIGGLPFASGPHYYPGVITHDTLLTDCTGGYVSTNSTSPNFIPIADGTTSGKLPATGNTKYIMFAATYYTTA